MKLYIIRTKEYYIDYLTCDCGDCIHYYNNILEEQPEICNYLEILGVDMPQIVIHKPSNNESRHSIFLRNVEAIDKYRIIAFVKYAYDNSPNDLYENLVFDVCEGGKNLQLV